MNARYRALLEGRISVEEYVTQITRDVDMRLLIERNRELIAEIRSKQPEDRRRVEHASRKLRRAIRRLRKAAS